MKYKIKINDVVTLEEITNYWTDVDYIQLLEKYNFPEGEKASKDSLKDLLFMAITDFEPNEAAAIILDYKLNNILSDNQIQQIANDMLLDKISEEYPDISLHATLYHINQLLFKAYNGKFPNTKATQILCTIVPQETVENKMLKKETILKLLSNGLADHNLIKRLFHGPMLENEPFPDADSILWNVESNDNQIYKLLTSNYWINKEDLIQEEFESTYVSTMETV